MCAEELLCSRTQMQETGTQWESFIQNGQRSHSEEVSEATISSKGLTKVQKQAKVIHEEEI